MTWFYQTVVDVSTNGDDVYDLTGTGDSLLVTSTGGLMAMAGGDGVNATGQDESIVMDGFAYSTYSNAIAMTGQYSQVLLNSTAQSSSGDGILAGGVDEIVTVNGSAYGGGNSNNNFIGIGVSVTGSGTAVQVNGSAQGSAYGVEFSGVTSGSVSVGSTGALDGFVGLALSAADLISVKNDGHIEGSAAGLESVNGETESIVNGGTIACGGGTAIGLIADVGDTVQNSGLLEGSYALFLQTGAEATLHNTGTIDGSIQVNDTSSLVFDNAGVYDGAEINLQTSADNILTNAGTMDAAITLGAPETTTSDTLTNTGTITGSVVFEGTDDTFTNSGTIHGPVYFGTDDTATVNHGTINGNVIMGLEGDFNNTGTIHGTVTLGDDDKFVNTGTINGNIQANTFDQITVDPGKLLGDVYAEAHDSFHFAGAYGTIDVSGFVGTGTGHDTLFFSTNDFANYTALLPHMTQAGADVLITLDTADVITLLNTSLSSLSSSDFAFT